MVNVDPTLNLCTTYPSLLCLQVTYIYPLFAALPRYPFKDYYPYYPYYYYPYDYPTTEILINAKNRELNALQENYEANLQDVEQDLEQSRIQTEELQNE